MKRHPSLEPFSRDHNDGLILARRLSEGGMAALPLFHQEWERELRDHFEEEVRLLGPLCGPDAQDRLHREHGQIQTLGHAAATDDDAARLGKLLEEHIRWEERELFPEIERTADSLQLGSLAHAAAALERRRWASDARRAELVARRESGAATTAADLGYLSRVADDLGPQWGMESEDLNATLLAWTMGNGVEEHVNDEVDVLVLAVEGRIELRIGDDSLTLGPGQMALIPKGARRSITCVSDRAAHLNIHKRRRKLMPGSLQRPPARQG
jgi:mannose-6-phosphate isomerase-like protein (cupin superfamily)